MKTVTLLHTVNRTLSHWGEYNYSGNQLKTSHHIEKQDNQLIKKYPLVYTRQKEPVRLLKQLTSVLVKHKRLKRILTDISQLTPIENLISG